jgi:hypothetical protein
MALCAFIKPGRERCKATAMKGYDTCYGHRPDLTEERRRNASKGGRAGGRGRVSRDVGDLKQRISEVIDAVLEGSQDRGRAAVAIQGFNALRGVLELERKIKETDELEARIEALERAQGQKGARKWGA